MPVVEISLVGGKLTQEQKTRIGSKICDILVGEILRLARESVWVVFNERNWRLDCRWKAFKRHP